jgi:hypothetical protein
LLGIMLLSSMRPYLHSHTVGGLGWMTLLSTL